MERHAQDVANGKYDSYGVGTEHEETKENAKLERENGKVKESDGVMDRENDARTEISDGGDVKMTESDGKVKESYSEDVKVMQAPESDSAEHESAKVDKESVEPCESEREPAKESNESERTPPGESDGVESDPTDDDKIPEKNPKKDEPETDENTNKKTDQNQTKHQNYDEIKRNLTGILDLNERVMRCPSLMPNWIMKGVTWEDVRQVYRRAAWIHCCGKANVLMQWAEFEEVQGGCGCGRGRGCGCGCGCGCLCVVDR